jgi:hypothetical protein
VGHFRAIFEQSAENPANLIVGFLPSSHAASMKSDVDPLFRKLNIHLVRFFAPHAFRD